ncbi:MAG: MBL fold metallo-hydrolase [Armatimonadetes bacterium]|nr:MBL fold metallo-hydrolase [Armatimonadota bacterium]
MIFETIESEGLAHLSYLLGDEDAGECVVIDPRRDVDAYLDAARRESARITRVIETHVHADFVSGSRELAARTGAPIYTGPGDAYGFPRAALNEGDTVQVGGLCLKALRTPGHTPEHISLVVSGGRGAADAWGVFTGDTLFAGEVGRPDLIGDGTEEELARRLFHSLHEKLLKLDDGIEVYPAHGQGSPCGGRIGDRKTSTIGYERRHNPRLRTDDPDAFVRELLESLPPAPTYYARLKRMNAAGPMELGCLRPVPLLDGERFEAEMHRPGTLVLDTRDGVAFGGAHVPGAINIPLRETFPIWAGWMLRPEQRFLLVADAEEDAHRVQRHLLRVGLDHLVGSLRRGVREWIEAGYPFAHIPQMGVHELYDLISNGHAAELQVLDVRTDGEWKEGHVPHALHVFAADLPERLDRLDKSRLVVVYCSTGFRSSIAASVLQRGGFRDVREAPGSMAAWRAAGLPLECSP